MAYRVATKDSITKGRPHLNLYVNTTAFTLDIEPEIKSLVIRAYPDTIGTTSPAARRFQDGWTASFNVGTGTYNPTTVGLEIAEVYGDLKVLDSTLFTANAIDAPKLCDLGAITVDTTIAYDVAPSRLTFDAVTGTDTAWVVEVTGKC